MKILELEKEIEEIKLNKELEEKEMEVLEEIKELEVSYNKDLRSLKLIVSRCKKSYRKIL
jgi:hypothetical protein